MSDEMTREIMDKLIDKKMDQMIQTFDDHLIDKI